MCAHINLGPEAVAVIARRPDTIPVACPCCHLPGQVDTSAELDGMLCPHCDVQAEAVQ